MKSERILILNVDDYEAGRYATTRVLQQAGFEVHEAATGEEALSKASAESPDLVILDINLPDIDGFEVCSRLKQEPGTAAIPVLQLSAAYTGTENRIRGLELGADGYLSQPVEPRELIANVRSLLRLKVAQQEAIASEQRLKAIVDAFALIVWRSSDRQSAKGYETWRAFTGQSLEEMQDGGWINAVHPDDRASAQQAWNEAVARGDRFVAVYRLRDRYGIYHFVETRGVPLRDISGAIVEWIGVCIDVDERKRAQDVQALLGSAGTFLSSSLDYRDTLNRVADLVTESFADWVYIDILTEDDTLELVTARHRDTSRDMTATANNVRNAETGTWSVIRSAQPAITTSSMLLPLVSRGTVIGVLGLFSDNRYDSASLAFAEELASRIALAIDNSRLFHQAVAGNKAKSEFLAVMSHELRTPLNAIIGYTDLLKVGIGGDLTKMQDDHVARIDASARHLLTLIDEVLTFSRLEAGREEVSYEEIDLAAVVSETTSLLAALAHTKGLYLKSDVPAKADMTTDGGKVRQILLNLISNAIKFTSAGGIDVVLREEPDALMLQVKDTGIGIDVAQHSTIFEPFRQIRRKGTLTSGTGLGLSVSRQLAEMLGGSLTVDSEVGAGSTFTLKLPRSKATK